MIQFFRSTTPVAHLVLFLLTAALQFNLFLYQIPWTSDSPSTLHRWLATIIEAISFGNSYVQVVFFILILFMQGLLVSRYINRIRLFDNQTLLPALAYITLISLFNRQLFLSPALFAAFPVIAWLGSIMSLHINRSFRLYFDAGLLIGLAGLLYQPAFLLYPLTIVGFLQSGMFDVRAWLTSLLGLFTLPYLIGVYFFLSGNWDATPLQSLFSSYGLIDIPLLAEPILLTKLGIMLFVFILAATLFFKRYLKSSILLRRNMQFAITAVITALVLSLIANTHFREALSLAVPPLAVMMSYFLKEAKKGFLIEFFYLALLTGIAVLQYTVEVSA